MSRLKDVLRIRPSGADRLGTSASHPTYRLQSPICQQTIWRRVLLCYRVPDRCPQPQDITRLRSLHDVEPTYRLLGARHPCSSFILQLYTLRTIFIIIIHDIGYKVTCSAAVTHVHHDTQPISRALSELVYDWATSVSRLTWGVHFVSWTLASGCTTCNQSVTNVACICRNNSYSICIAYYCVQTW